MECPCKRHTSVDGVIQEDALVPVPIAGEIETVRQAVGSYLAWPRDMISFTPTIAKVYEFKDIFHFPWICTWTCLKELYLCFLLLFFCRKGKLKFSRQKSQKMISTCCMTCWQMWSWIKMSLIVLTCCINMRLHLWKSDEIRYRLYVMPRCLDWRKPYTCYTRM